MDTTTELAFKTDGTEYAQVTESLGGFILRARCFDGVSRLCHIRGRLRNKVWINKGGILFAADMYNAQQLSF